MTTMRAAVMSDTGGPEVLRVVDVATPAIGPTQVLVRVAGVGVCGHDQADRLGLTRVSLPVVLGHEISGVVEEVGSAVRGIAVGDRVASKQFSTCGHCRCCRSGDELRCDRRQFVYGGYAELVAIEATAIAAVPDGVDLAEASVVACAVGTCVQALERIARLRPGDNVVVTGAGGGLGIHGLQVAKSMGGRTVATTSSPAKVPVLRRWGADEVVVTGGGDETDQLMECTGGAGVDVVLDNVGAPAVFDPIFRAMAHRGRYIFLGQVARTKVQLYPASLFATECTITGSTSTLMSSFHRSMDLVGSGAVTPVVERHPLEAAAETHRLLDQRQIIGRAVLIP